MDESTDDKEIVPAFDREIAPTDPEYPIYLFAKNIRPDKDMIESAAKSVYETVVKASPFAAQLSEAAKKGVRYVVDTPDSMLEALEAGRIKFTREKNDLMFAQLRDSNGHYSDKVPIKREEFARGVDPVQMANAIQLQSLQNQMQEVQASIYAIDRNVKEVIQGQRSDRRALYLSGLTLYLEARDVSDESMRKNLLAQAQRSLSDASNQIALELQNDIDWIREAKANNFKGMKDREKLLGERISAINEAFANVHQASLLRAAIYGELGEFKALARTLESYSRFISEQIVGNAGLLAECDPDDLGFEHGTWSKRAQLSLDVEDVVKRLESPEQVFYLDAVEEEVPGEAEEE